MTSSSNSTRTAVFARARYRGRTSAPIAALGSATATALRSLLSYAVAKPYGADMAAPISSSSSLAAMPPPVLAVVRVGLRVESLTLHFVELPTHALEIEPFGPAATARLTDHPRGPKPLGQCHFHVVKSKAVDRVA